MNPAIAAIIASFHAVICQLIGPAIGAEPSYLFMTIIAYFVIAESK